MLCIDNIMQELTTEPAPRGFKPIFGSGFVSNNWGGAMLEDGPGMIAVGVLFGAFFGLILGLITMHVARFISFATGRHVGGVGWTIVCVAVGAIAFGVMTARDSDAP
jgi:hypothetical protein